MKIALPTRGNAIDDHFGQCETYTIFTIDENDQIAGKEIIPSVTGCGCKSGIAEVLKEKGVEIMLAGNMGEGALNVLKGHDIAVFRGCRGDVTDVTMSFLRGELNDSGESCGEHHGGHNHGSQGNVGCQGGSGHGGHGHDHDHGHGNGGHGHGGGGRHGNS